MVEKLIYDLETDIIEKIAYYLSRGAIASADYQISKLGQLGALNKEIIKIINQYRSKILLQTRKEITESAEDILAKIRAHSPKQYRAYASMTPAMKRIVDLWVNSATSKINLSMATLAQKAGETYVAAVSKASLAVVTGTETLQRSVMQSIGELENIDAFVDKAGRHWTPEAYVNMIVRDNQRRVSTEAMFQTASESGTDLIEISSHLGARPKCAPYQGKIFSISGNSNKYPSLVSTSFGQIDGLNGINCGHVFYPYFDGVSTKTYEPYPAKENKKAYEESQKQRAIERKIRHYKREEQKWSATENGEKKAAYYKTKVKESQSEMREFVKKTNLPRQYDREAIYH